MSSLWRKDMSYRAIMDEYGPDDQIKILRLAKLF